ncbi:MAG: hypothetical protein ABJN84_15475 [Flavobacteriaceae bacterium]
MRKLNTEQKVIFILGILGIAIGAYGKWQGWERNDYFIPLYTGISFIWIPFINTNRKCCNPFKKRTLNRE